MGVSSALRKISNENLYVTEFTLYNVLKEAVWAKLTRQPSRPDVEKVKKDIRSEVQEEFRNLKG